ncbi:MAG TPA: hypothetical protein VF928_11380 [Usitatibacteraceae bacterium]
MNIRGRNGNALIKCALLAATVLFAHSSAAQAISEKQEQAADIPSTRQPLSGRLFFSREQRERMDRAREGGALAADEIAVDSPAWGINGFVKRSDGETAVWVDGKMLRIPAGAAEKVVPGVIEGSANTLKIKLTGNPGPTAAKAGVGNPVARKAHRAHIPQRVHRSLPPN